MFSVNGTPCSSTATTLAELVADLGHDAAAVATALNGSFVPRARRADTPITPSDRIEILAPMQGG